MMAVIYKEPEIASFPIGLSHRNILGLSHRNSGRPLYYTRYGSQLASRTGCWESIILLLSPLQSPQGNRLTIKMSVLYTLSSLSAEM